MFCAQGRNKGLMCLEETVILDGGSQRLAFHEMTSRVLIPRGLGPIECVVNHGPEKKSRGEWMFTLQQPRSRVEQIIGISIDFGAALEHELGRVRQIGPFNEEIQGRREALESESVDHGPFFCGDVFEVRE